LHQQKADRKIIVGFWKRGDFERERRVRFGGMRLRVEKMGEKGKMMRNLEKCE
jgi:hypothetical protein